MAKKNLKRGLALGALMAFVITGSAMAAEQHQELNNNKGVVVSSDTGHSKPRVEGGNYINTEETPSVVDSQYVVSGGKWDMVIGGHYVQNIQTVDTNVRVNSTNVTITGGEVEQVIGGTAGTDNKNLNHTWTGSSNLTITGGKFGAETTTASDNAPEFLVIGGDLIKYEDDSASTLKGASTIQDVNTNISGGTFNSAIFGGSAAIQYYGDSNHPEGSGIDVNVANATTTITGGTFNHVIAAGGLAYGGLSSSTVGKAVLNISGADTKINCDIYAGGLSGGLGVGPDVVKSNTVNNAEINIENVNVKNVYGTSGVINFADNKWNYSQSYNGENKGQAVDTTLTLTNVKAETVDIQEGSVTLSATEDGETKIQTLKTGSDVTVSMVADSATTDALSGDAKAFKEKITITNAYDGYEKVEGKMNAGDIVGDVTFKLDAEGNVIEGSVVEKAHEGNASVAHMANIALMSWRAETNDMNKRMGELRNANGEYGVWARMVGGEDEFKNATYEYTQYQLGYDEKLSVDPSWTVGVALSYTDGESNFGQGSGENTHKGLSVYGSKLNDDGSFIDLIAKYSRLEHDLTIDGDKGDYSTNGYSVSAEYGKRFEQGKGLWIEPQVELTYGKVKSADYKLGAKTVSQDAMESLVGRIGFSLGKDIKDGNVYARASYLYDFEGETNVAFANGASRNFAYDLGGGWWEVGVGANINLSKATYIYADVEKTFGGEVDTNWQWNLGVRYSF